MSHPPLDRALPAARHPAVVGRGSGGRKVTTPPPLGASGDRWGLWWGRAAQAGRAARRPPLPRAVFPSPRATEEATPPTASPARRGLSAHNGDERGAGRRGGPGAEVVHKRTKKKKGKKKKKIDIAEAPLLPVSAHAPSPRPHPRQPVEVARAPNGDERGARWRGGPGAEAVHKRTKKKGQEKKQPRPRCRRSLHTPHHPGRAHVNPSR